MSVYSTMPCPLQFKVSGFLMPNPKVCIDEISMRSRSSKLQACTIRSTEGYKALAVSANISKSQR